MTAKADLPGVTPHTLRHTMGSTAVSSGEALALTGAILSHANLRSTAIYAHVQNDPSRRAADRVTNVFAAALAGSSSFLRSRRERPQLKSGAQIDRLAPTRMLPASLGTSHGRLATLCRGGSHGPGRAGKRLLNGPQPPSVFHGRLVGMRWCWKSGQEAKLSRT